MMKRSRAQMIEKITKSLK